MTTCATQLSIAIIDTWEVNLRRERVGWGSSWRTQSNVLIALRWRTDCGEDTQWSKAIYIIMGSCEWGMGSHHPFCDMPSTAEDFFKFPPLPESVKWDSHLELTSLCGNHYRFKWSQSKITRISANHCSPCHVLSPSSVGYGCVTPMRMSNILLLADASRAEFSDFQPWCSAPTEISCFEHELDLRTSSWPPLTRDKRPL